MAETSQQQQPQQPQEAAEPPKTNGIDLTEEEKSKMRPADIDADMREMERRKRVEMMINSRLFREELERIIETQMKDGAGPSGLLQQISEMMGYQGARFNGNVFKNSNCVVPINDIRGVESMGYAKGEKLLRCKLAAVFRLLDLYGWTQGVGGMITARLNQDQEHFLVNPYGLLYHEVTASSLVKADMQGNIVEQGTTNFNVHIAEYQLHSTIHAARPDIKCIVHIATPSVTAISSLKCALLPLSQESIVIGELSTHQYVGSLEPEEREKLARSLGPINKVILLTNRGALCCGETIEEAFYNVYNTVLASETQLKLMPVGIDNLVLITDEARKAIYEASRKAPVPQQSSVAPESSALAEKVEKRYRVGGTEFEALMRMLDNAGFRTGYIYRQPLVKTEPPRPRNDVEVPPAVSSLGYLLEEEELYKSGNWKFGRKGHDRTRWLNSPNVYQKVEILETGTPDPKKITKWVSDGSPTHSSTPVKIEGALQFVPKNTNPKEFKQLQQQIKDYRRADKISAGPQSHILEGVTWEEAKKMQDATISGTGEQVVLVGAASKGIIQRGFQHNAMVYKTPYAKNPFDQVTDQELDQYKKEVERKTKGDGYDESQSESEGLSSFNISRATHDTSTAKSPVQSPVSVTSETEEESRDEPKVLRIETKQVPVPSQPEVVLSDGISGVWSFSNSRSPSEDSSVSSSTFSSKNTIDSTCLCKLERTRSQELARPMKPTMINACSATEIRNRIMRAKFFENYDSILKQNYNISNLKKDSGSNLKVNSSMSDLDKKQQRFGISKSMNRIADVNCQLECDSEAVLTNFTFSKRASRSYAEKINLSRNCTATEKEDSLLLSPRMVQMHMKSFNRENVSNNRRSLEKVFDAIDRENNPSIDSDYNSCSESISNMGTERNNGFTHFKHDIMNNNAIINEKSNNEFYILQNFEGKEVQLSDESDEKVIDTVVDEANVGNEEITRNKKKRYSNTINLFIQNKPNVSNNDSNENSALEKSLEVKIKPKKISSNLDNNEKSIESNCENLSTSPTNQELDIFKNAIDLELENILPQITRLASNDEENLLLDSLQNKLTQIQKGIESFIASDYSQDELKESDDNLTTDSNRTRKKNLSKRASKLSVVNNDASSDDEILDKKPKKSPKNMDHYKTLELTYSELERSSTYPSSRSSVMSEEDLVVKRISEEFGDNFSDIVINSNLTNLGKKSSILALQKLQNNQISTAYKADPMHVADLYRLNPGFDLDIVKLNKMNVVDGVIVEDPDFDGLRIAITNNGKISEKPQMFLFVDDSDDNKEENSEMLDDTEYDFDTNFFKDEEESKVNRRVEEDVVESDETVTVEDEETADSNDDNNEDIIWLEISGVKGTEDVYAGEDIYAVKCSEASFQSNASNQGSDLLEVSAETFLELKSSCDEVFNNVMRSSVDEIISEIEKSPDEKRKSNIALLNVPSDVISCSESELTDYAENIALLKFVKSIIKDVIYRLPCYDDDCSAGSKASSFLALDLEETSINPGIYVVHEIIHHVVDKNSSLDVHDNKSKIIIMDKEVKEGVNKELKNLKDYYDAEDEMDMKCSTPKDLSPSRSKNSSPAFCKATGEDATTASKDQHNLNAATSSCSSSSAESHPVEHEIPTDTTDNDTKSDNSKEKQTDSSENLKNQSKSSSDSSSSKISSDSSDAQTCDTNDECTVLETDANNKVISNLVHYSSKSNLNAIEEPEEISERGNENENENENEMKPVKTHLTFSLIHYEGEHDSNAEHEPTNNNEHDSDTDTNIKEILQNLQENQEELDQLWENCESKSEEIYKQERLNETSSIKSSSDDESDECDEEIRQLSKEVMESMSPFFSENEKLTSFIGYDDNDCSDEAAETEDQCTCSNDEANRTVTLQNTRSNSLSPINEEPEMESELNESEQNESGPIEILPPIFDEKEEEEELELSCISDNVECDSKATEFYSCHNSVSMKSCFDKSEIANSTQSLSTDETSGRENVYSADVSMSNEASNLSAAISRSDSTLSECTNNNDGNSNTTDNYADESCVSPADKEYESFTLDCLTISCETREFLQLEEKCSNTNSDVDSTSDFDVSLSNLFQTDDSRVVCAASNIL